LNMLLLWIAAASTFTIRRTPVRVLALTTIATVLAYAYFLPEKLNREAEIARIVARNPFESLNERLPELPKISRDSPPKDANALDGFEEQIVWQQGFSVRNDYGLGLKLLHDHSIKGFVDSWGFGVGRMPPRYEYQFAERERSDPSPLQPQNPVYSHGSPPPPTLNAQYSLHDEAKLDFLYQEGFGYFKDRQHVAGFRSHRFKNVPTYDQNRSQNPPEWEVARLELVSLLMHKEPSVYLSDRLPQMDALKGVPTRPLDSFESEGLAVLRKGEDMYVRGDRMFGSIRSTKQCLACHGGDRGMLLGAFTYTLRPAAK
jgi:hypothetical protein